MNRIAELRKLKKISQADFGKDIGVAQNTVSQWERGAREPDLTTLNAIASYFGVSVDYLMGNASELSFALFNGEEAEIDDDLMQEVEGFAAFARQKKAAPSEDEAELMEFMTLVKQLTPEQRSVLMAAAKGFSQER